MTAWLLPGVAALLAASCAPPSRSAPRLGLGDGFVGEGDTTYFREAPRATLVPAREIGEPEVFPKSDGGGSSTATRPRSRKRINLELKDALFDDAARLLANAGQFDLALSTPAALRVTVSLKNVDPFDALVLLADTKRLDVSFARGVAMVSGRTRSEPDARSTSDTSSESGPR